jgi:hypothetical protein
MTRGKGSLALKFLLRLLLIACAIVSPAVANTIHVPQDQPTIQAGIDAANPGDTVLVAPGTYYENIDFKGKAITVTSSGGAATTIIDGRSIGGMATVLFSGGETSASVLSNLTIRGGGDQIFGGSSNGGIYVSGTMGYVAGPAPTIKNNVITANYCHAIGVQDGSPTIQNNEISGTLQNTLGTGAQESYCGPNDAIYLGGTSNYQVGGTTVIGNTIENNAAGGSAIHVNAAQKVLVIDNVIRNNYARSTGSAFMSENVDDSVVVQNLVYGNTSTCGGALSFNGGILIANNTLADNLYVSLFSGSECTAIAQIYPDNYSYGESYPDRVIINNIISGSTSYPAVNCAWLNPPSLSDQPTFQNDILNNAGGPFFGSYCIDVSGQDGNITSDPQFVNRSTNNYHLQSTSPAIDMGENTVFQLFQAMTGQSLTTDFDGNPRVQNTTGKGCIIDIGAYEYPGNVSECGTQVTLTSSLNPSMFGQSVTFTAALSSSSGTPTGSVQFLDGTTGLSTQPVSGSGTSTYTTSTLSAGSHTITANFRPTGTFAPGSASLTQVVTGYATTTTLTCQPASITVGLTALLTASVTSQNGTPTGAIAFTDNGAALSTQNLLNGSASLTYTGNVATTHTITATYTPTGSFSGSSATCTEVVTALPTTSTLSATPTSATAGSPVALTVVVAPTSVNPTSASPTGTVTFFNGASPIGTAPANPSPAHTGIATITLTNLPVGTDQLTCQYSGDSGYAASSCNTVPVTITGIPTSLTLTPSPNPARAFQPITLTAKLTSTSSSFVAQGQIAFFLNGTSIGTAPVSSSGIAPLTVNFPAGTDTLTANYASPSTCTCASAQSNPVTEVVTPDATTTTLAVSPNPATQNATVTLIAQVAPASSQTVPTGSVTFYDSATNLGTVPVDSAGAATFTSSSFAVGTHTLTAVYSGSPNDLASTSAAEGLTVNLQDFTLAVPPSLTIQTAYHASLKLTLTSVGSFADTIELNCLNLPRWAACHFADTPPLLGPNQTVPASIDIQTDAIYDYKSELHSPLALRTSIALATLLPLGLLAAPRRRKLLKRSTLLAVLLLSASLLSLGGCSGLYPPSVAPGTYAITIAGHGARTGLNHTATFNLVVTP